MEGETVIDFSAVWKVLMKRKIHIGIFALTCAIITAIVMVNEPNEYTSTASVMPELESSSIGGGLSKFAGLASLAGVDLAGMTSSDAVRPDLYPSIINNTSFYLYLLEQKVNTSENKPVKFLDFYKKAYELEDSTGKDDFLASFTKSFSSEKPPIQLQPDSTNSFIFMPETTGKIIKELKDKILSQIDKKSGIVSISVELPDPVTAAHVAKISMDYLTSFVTNYRTEKSIKDLDFIAEQLGAAKGKFYSTQTKKAQYADQFRLPTIRLQAADIQRERIESNYQVSSSFYSQLQKQYETAKMKVQEQTPIFKMLEKPIIPYEKSGPKRTLSVIAAFILATIIGIIVVILTNYRSILYEEVIFFEENDLTI